MAKKRKRLLNGEKQSGSIADAARHQNIGENESVAMTMAS